MYIYIYIYCILYIWEFPKIRGTFLGGPSNKDYCLLGSILGVPLFWETSICICTKFYFAEALPRFRLLMSWHRAYNQNEMVGGRILGKLRRSRGPQPVKTPH